MVLMGLSTIAPPIMGMFGLTTILYYTQNNYKVFGGVDCHKLGSWTAEHKEAERKRLLNMEREAAPDHPVVQNPFRHNIPATVRNASELGNLE